MWQMKECQFFAVQDSSISTLKGGSEARLEILNFVAPKWLNKGLKNVRSVEGSFQSVSLG